MRRRGGRLVALLVLVLAGVVDHAPAARSLVQLERPDALHVRVTSWDGLTELDGWVVLPAVIPPGGVPVVLRSTPYQGNLDASLNDANRDSMGGKPWPVPVELLLEHGYAVAAFNVRGTGNSGGCFDLFGTADQRDQYFLVQWLAQQWWSNRNVGMMGLSYDGTTPLAAAIGNPPALKTVVVAGVVPDVYTAFISPQGALTEDEGPLLGPFYLGPTLAPARSTDDNPAELVARMLDYLGVSRERLCPDVADYLEWFEAGFTGWAGRDDRNQAFHDPRRLIDRFPGVKASVLLVHGFQDYLAWGEDVMWQALRRAPKRQIEGQWAHAMPHVHKQIDGWDEELLGWLDHWLKGKGPAPENEVRYQPFDPRSPQADVPWRTSPSWPPSPSDRQVLYLGGGALRPDPVDDRSVFVSVPTSELATAVVEARTEPETRRIYAPPCPVPGTTASPPTSLVFETPALGHDVLLAGNPMAYLRLSTEQRSGNFALRLFSLGPDFRCADGVVSGSFRFLSEGAVDLRFFGGNFDAQDFDGRQPTNLRVDLQNLAEIIPAGHRLAATFSFGAQKGNVDDDELPAITVHGGTGPFASHLVLPVAEGNLRGKPPTLRYPPRPFAPQ